MTLNKTAAMGLFIGAASLFTSRADAQKQAAPAHADTAIAVDGTRIILAGQFISNIYNMTDKSELAGGYQFDYTGPTNEGGFQSKARLKIADTDGNGVLNTQDEYEFSMTEYTDAGVNKTLVVKNKNGAEQALALQGGTPRQVFTVFPGAMPDPAQKAGVEKISKEIQKRFNGP